MYEFLREGQLPEISFKDGDALVVRPIGATVVVQTGARNSFTFEFKKEELKAKLAKQVPLNTIGDPDDVAYAVLYLASDESKFVTGSELKIDGGISAM